MIQILSSLDFELSAIDFNILVVLFNIKNNTNPFIVELIKYFKVSFNPKDKRHIHILFFVLIKAGEISELKKIIKEYKQELLNDNYGKYLIAHLFKYKKNLSTHWIGGGIEFIKESILRIIWQC